MTRKLFRIKKEKPFDVVLNNSLVLKEQVVFVYDSCVVLVFVVSVYHFCVHMCVY